MFDIGWSELVLIGLVALIVIGPKELPTVLRTAGQWMGKVKRMASEFQGQFQEALREAEVADLKEQAEDITGSLKSITEYDPLADIDNDGDKDKEKDDATELGRAVRDAGTRRRRPRRPPRPPPTSRNRAARRSPRLNRRRPRSFPRSKPTPSKSAEDLTPAETPPPKQAGGSA